MNYDRINWVNDAPPRINAANLNHMDAGIKAAHDLLADIGTSGTVTSVNGIEPDESGAIVIPTGGRGVSSITDTDGDGVATITYTDATTEALPLPPGPQGDVGPVPLVESTSQPAVTNTLWFDPDDPGEVGSGGSGAIQGTGQPNGVVTADIGAEYVDLAQTAGAWKWLKTSGMGTNTGWVCVQGDTGWRNLGPDFASTVVNAQYLWMIFRRINERVYYKVSDSYIVVKSGTTPGYRVILNTPLGFRSATPVWVYQLGQVGNATRMLAFDTVVHAYNTPTNTADDISPDKGSGSIHYLTDDPWPTTVLGQEG